MDGYVDIVYDNNKLRAKAENGGYVRFPRDKRIEGARYWVEDLKEGKSGSWMACGEIKRIK